MRNLKSKNNKVKTKTTPDQRTTFGNILIVDDKHRYRAENSLVARELGFKPMTACSGAEAINIFKKQKDSVSFIILDYNMPEMNGDEVLRRLKEIDEDVLVDVCSDGLSKKKIIDVLHAGAKTFIPKPILARDLEFFIEAMFGPREALAAQG
jgi:DNA-binding response OmpR family regulator